jgi:uncharacterized membrane protein YdjX (TVP38/TMEM64 family)
MEVSWTTVISMAITTAISSTISSATMFLTMRYLGKIAERIEHKADKPDK